MMNIWLVAVFVGFVSVGKGYFMGNVMYDEYDENECDNEIDETWPMSHLVSFLGDEELIHFDDRELYEQMRHPKAASLQHYFDPMYHTNHALNLTELTQFSNIDAQSLQNGIESTYQLCIEYISPASDSDEYDDNNSAFFHGEAVAINATHLLTARHNTQECIINKNGKFKPCSNGDMDSPFRLQFSAIYISRTYRDCQSDQMVSNQNIIRQNDEYNKPHGEYYGPLFDGTLSVNDLALIKLEMKAKHYVGLESNAFEQFDKMNRIIMTGFGVIYQDPTKTVELKDKKSSAVRMSDILQYFKIDRKTFSITTEFEIAKDLKIFENDMILYHHLPHWYGYSGCPIFSVDETNGKLHFIAIEIGGYIDWNVAITVNHPFIQQIIYDNTDNQKTHL